MTCALAMAATYYVLWLLFIFIFFESNTTCLDDSEVRRPNLTYETTSLGRYENDISDTVSIGVLCNPLRFITFP